MSESKDTIELPFNSLLDGTYLQNRSTTTTYEILIDCFRWCRSGNDESRREMVPDGLLLSGKDAQREFAIMIHNARQVPGLLPSWFYGHEIMECVSHAMHAEGFRLEDELERKDCNIRWGDWYMTSKLALLGSLIFFGKAETLCRGQGKYLEADAALERQIMTERI